MLVRYCRANIQQTLVNNLSATITLAQSSAGEHQSQLLAYQVAKDGALAEAAKGPTGNVVPASAQAGQEGLGFLREDGIASKAKGKKCVDLAQQFSLREDADAGSHIRRPPMREASSQAHQRKRNRN